MVLAVAAAALTGCSLLNPQTTQLQYVPYDGAEYVAESGLSVHNVLVASEGNGAAGTLLGAIVNDGEETVAVEIAPGPETGLEASLRTRVEPGTRLDVGPESELSLQLDSVDAGPGELVPMLVTTDLGEVGELLVPIVDGTLEEYAEFVPGPVSSAVPALEEPVVPDPEPSDVPEIEEPADTAPVEPAPGEPAPEEPVVPAP